MGRYAIKIEYNGEGFVGWQKQKAHLGVQQIIEDALLRLEPTASGVQGAGRTDAGVHATGQVAHFDMVQDWAPFRLKEALNFHLKPNPVSIIAIAAVDDEFHARFDAQERHYVFRLIARREPVVFEKGLVWHVRGPLDVDAMQEAANHLLGRHDFTTFRSTMCQAPNPVKTLDRLDITHSPVTNGVELRFDVRARSFLHNQVRSFVGSLKRVGAGSWTPDDMRAALEAKDRVACGLVSPPHGLYLANVVYPTDIFADEL